MSPETRKAFTVEMLGDDGEMAIVPGWVSKREFRRQLIDVFGVGPEWCNLRDIEHAYATMYEIDGETGWRFHQTPDKPGAVKATWWVM